jgi:hypothetical protein
MERLKEKRNVKHHHKRVRPEAKRLSQTASRISRLQTSPGAKRLMR